LRSSNTVTPKEKCFIPTTLATIDGNLVFSQFSNHDDDDKAYAAIHLLSPFLPNRRIYDPNSKFMHNEKI
jgi:hypothetical protein